MAGPATSDEFEFSYRFSGFGGTSPVTSIGIFTNTATDEAIRGRATALWTALRPFTSKDWQLVEIAIKQGPVASGPTWTIPVGTWGQDNGDSVPANTSFLIRKAIAGTSNRFAGRMFWPGPRENKIDAGGVLVAGEYIDMQVALDEWVDDLDTVVNGYPLVFPSDGGSSTQVWKLDLQGKVATQRRRLRR